MAGQLREISQNNASQLSSMFFSVTPDQQQSFLEKLTVGDLLMRNSRGIFYQFSLKPGRDKNYELRAVGKSQSF
jgi:hypothetical protein